MWPFTATYICNSRYYVILTYAQFVGKFTRLRSSWENSQGCAVKGGGGGECATCRCAIIWWILPSLRILPCSYSSYISPVKYLLPYSYCNSDILTVMKANNLMGNCVITVFYLTVLYETKDTKKKNKKKKKKKVLMQSTMIIIILKLVHKDIQALSDSKIPLIKAGSCLTIHSIFFFQPLEVVYVEYPLSPILIAFRCIY